MKRTLAAILICGSALLVGGCDAGGRGGGGGGGGGGGDGPDMAKPGKLPFKMETVIVPGTPSDAPTKFGGAADPSLRPTVVYPPDGVLVPPNLSELEVQFTSAPGTSLFEISFVGPSIDLRVYTICVTVGSGCGYLPDEATWLLLSTQGRGDTVKVTVKGTAGGGGGVGATNPRDLSFGDEDLLGGLYYWAAGSGTLKRYDFGRRGQKAENFYTPTNAGAICVGCHALSRDGTKIAVGMNIPGPAALRVLDVASKTALWNSGATATGGGSNFEALSPDASKVLTGEGADLIMRDSMTGAVIGTGPAMANGAMPDWSADGGKAVFARPAMVIPFTSPGVDAASIMLSAINGTAMASPSTLVQGGTNLNNFYPAFAPDASMVAFNRAMGNSFDAPDARVMVISTVANSVPVDLKAVNDVSIGNSWPKFAPFVTHFGGKTIFWLTFSSRRDYGLRIDNGAKAADAKVAQVWMVAVSPDRTEIPNDAGFPAFWLPFQEAETGNHIAQWTEKVARMPCSPGPDQNGCPPGEMCENGECVPEPIK